MEQGQVKSAFNSALSYCEEISTLRRHLHNARIEHNYDMQYELLKAYYLALSARMSKRLQEKHDTLFAEGTVAYEEINKAMKSKQSKINQKFFDKLLNWEIALRKDENQLGLLVMDSDDPLSAIAGGQE